MATRPDAGSERPGYPIKVRPRCHDQSSEESRGGGECGGRPSRVTGTRFGGPVESNEGGTFNRPVPPHVARKRIIPPLHSMERPGERPSPAPQVSASRQKPTTTVNSNRAPYEWPRRWLTVVLIRGSTDLVWRLVGLACPAVVPLMTAGCS